MTCWSPLFPRGEAATEAGGFLAEGAGARVTGRCEPLWRPAPSLPGRGRRRRWRVQGRTPEGWQVPGATHTHTHSAEAADTHKHAPGTQNQASGGPRMAPPKPGTSIAQRATPLRTASVCGHGPPGKDGHPRQCAPPGTRPLSAAESGRRAAGSTVPIRPLWAANTGVPLLPAVGLLPVPGAPWAPPAVGCSPAPADGGLTNQ